VKVVRKVGNHDLGLGGNTVLGGTALLARTEGVRLAGLAWVDGQGVLVTGSSAESLVGGLGQRKDLTRNVGGTVGLGFGRLLTLVLAWLVLY